MRLSLYTSKKLATLFFAITLFALTGAINTSFGQADDHNTRILKALDPNWNQLLSVSLAPTTQPVVKDGRVDDSRKVIICKSEQVTAGDGDWIQEGAILNPSGTVAWPGALLIGDRNLAQGTPTPLTLPRGPVTILVDLPGLTAQERTVKIKNPTNVTVKNAIDKAVQTWLRKSVDWNPPLKAFGESQKSFSQSQVGVDLGFGAQWTSGSVSAAMKMQSDHERTVTMQVFKQVYFSVEIEDTGTPGSFFAANYKLGANDVSNTAPPMYVRSVDYGRLIVAQMQVDKALTEIEAEAAMKYAGSVTVEGNVSTKIKNAAESAQFRAIAIGGGVNGEAADLFSGDFKAFRKMIADGIRFSRQNPAVPIAYKFASVNDRVLRGINATTTYVKSECEEFPNRSIEFRSDGWFVSRFHLQWMEPTGPHGIMMPKVWVSGDKTSPYQSGRIYIPGDAQIISIVGENYTGLVWDPVRKPLSLQGGDLSEQHSCFKLSGTTLSPSYGGCQ